MAAIRSGVIPARLDAGGVSLPESPDSEKTNFPEFGKECRSAGDIAAGDAVLLDEWLGESVPAARVQFRRRGELPQHQ